MTVGIDEGLTKEGDSSKFKTNNYSKFRNEDKLEKYIVKHLSEYRTYSSDDYVRRATELLNSEDNENIKSFISKNGKLYSIKEEQPTKLSFLVISLSVE